MENQREEDKKPETKTPQAKEMKKKALPFDPEKIKAATAAAKSKRTNTLGAKPTGVKKSINTKTAKRGKNAGPSLDDMLSKARRWVEASTMYMIRNPETTCFGLSCRKSVNERSEITIIHTEYCDCLDVRLLHVCQHVDALVKRGLLARRSRDAFVIAIKICLELPEPIPKAMRFPPLKKQVIKRWKSEMDAEDEIIHVVETYNHYNLIEKWKNLTAYKERLIWKDW
ncbi:hypothetical protein F5Y10DRAFT_249400 [Nemania abortiva]|nr:hypothetical protein F5Y10DRAFT_249400 [Nemania abortiva]